MANISRSRKSGFTLRSGVMRRETAWVGGVFSSTALATASSAALINSFGAGVLALRPFTIVRTRGLLWFRSDQVAVGETQRAAYGEAVVSDQSVAIGITAVPTLVTDSFSDLWFVFETLFNDMAVTTDIGRLRRVNPDFLDLLIFAMIGFLRRLSKRSR